MVRLVATVRHDTLFVQNQVAAHDKSKLCASRILILNLGFLNFIFALFNFFKRKWAATEFYVHKWSGLGVTINHKQVLDCYLLDLVVGVKDLAAVELWGDGQKLL
jgi:hypothetical protein